MQRTPRSRVPTRERHLARLRLLKRRVVTGSVLCFGALVGLTARHTLGTRHSVARQVPAAAPVRAARPAARVAFFDERDAGAYAFDDPAQAPASPPPASQPEPAPLPPPVVESSVS